LACKGRQQATKKEKAAVNTTGWYDSIFMLLRNVLLTIRYQRKTLEKYCLLESVFNILSDSSVASTVVDWASCEGKNETRRKRKRSEKGCMKMKFQAEEQER